MNNLIAIQQSLPSNLEDLSKFVLVGREKLTAVRAEIRAIDKVKLAEEVREQKKEEAQMLAEALLDAEVRIGDLLKQIPKASGKRTDITSSQQCEKVDNTFPRNFEKTHETKQEVITKLGFNKDQANRFETLSSNKDIVEQVKAEARENEDIPTRSRVLQIVKEKTKQQEFIENEYKKIENETAVQKNIHNAVYKILCTDISDEYLGIWYKGLDRSNIETIEDDINRAIKQYEIIKNFIKNKKTIRRIK